MNCLGDIDIAVLAGGLGTRIKGVLGDTPKVLAPVNGKPYIDHLLDWLASFGANRVTLCLGHQADKVVDHLADRAGIQAVIEPKPLGTGGALRFARNRLSSNPVLVMNGDTWLETDLCAFLESHARFGKAVSILCVKTDDAARFGSVEVNDALVTRFVEKDPTGHAPGLISSGVYLLSQAALDDLCRSEGASLERDFFGRFPAGAIHGFVPRNASFIDIGTPESLAAASTVLPARKDR